MCRHQCPISYWVHCPAPLNTACQKNTIMCITSMSHFILSTLSCNLVPLNTACQKNTIMCRLHQCPISYWVHCPVIWYLLIQPVKKIQLCADYINVPFILSTLSCNHLNTASIMCRLHQCPISEYTVIWYLLIPVIWYLLIQPVKINTIMCRLHQCPISYWVHCPVIWYLLIQPVKKIQLCADYINVPFHTEYTVL